MFWHPFVEKNIRIYFSFRILHSLKLFFWTKLFCYILAKSIESFVLSTEKKKRKNLKRIVFFRKTFANIFNSSKLNFRWISIVNHRPWAVFLSFWRKFNITTHNQKSFNFISFSSLPKNLLTSWFWQTVSIVHDSLPGLFTWLDQVKVLIVYREWLTKKKEKKLSWWQIRLHSNRTGMRYKNEKNFSRIFRPLIDKLISIFVSINDKTARMVAPFFFRFHFIAMEMFDMFDDEDGIKCLWNGLYWSLNQILA